GIQIFISLYGLTTFLESPLAVRKGRAPYIITGLFICTLFTLSTVLDAYTSFRTLFEAQSGTDILRLTDTFDRTSWVRNVSLFVGVFGLFVADGLLASSSLYRCFILWKDRLWVLIIPGLNYLSIIGIGLYISAPNVETDPYIGRKLHTAFTLLSAILNISMTFLLCFRLLRARKSMSEAFSRSHLKVYSRMAIILIEAALPVTIFGVGQAILLILPEADSAIEESKRYITLMVFAGLYFLSATLAPQIIIFRVTTGRSFATEVSEGMHISSPEKGGGPVFAAAKDASFESDSNPNASV
ncbi:hypothetical protein FA15DRAFT_604722, partial [Coprinopsis marcescibilis]